MGSQWGGNQVRFQQPTLKGGVRTLLLQTDTDHLESRATRVLISTATTSKSLYDAILDRNSTSFERTLMYYHFNVSAP